jgi:hypothetical protein
MYPSPPTFGVRAPITLSYLARVVSLSLAQDPAAAENPTSEFGESMNVYLRNTAPICLAAARGDEPYVPAEILHGVAVDAVDDAEPGPLV